MMGDSAPPSGAGDTARADRVARYKEERRRQLASQFGARPNTEQQPGGRRFINRPRSAALPDEPRSNGEGSSSSDGILVRTTRASRLRAAAAGTAADLLPVPRSAGSCRTPDLKEKSPMTVSTGSDSPCVAGRPRPDKDKSSKRKSNLNRALNSEETTPEVSDEVASRRRRRRMLDPSDILVSLNESGLTSSGSSASSRLTPQPQLQAPSPTQPRTPRRSDLSVHMENARRGIRSPQVPTQRPRTAEKKEEKSLRVSTHKVTDKRSLNDEQKTVRVAKHRDSEKNDETKPMRSSSSSKSDDQRESDRDNRLLRTQRHATPDRRTETRSKAIDKSKYDYMKRTDELAALTRETLARVERLASKTQKKTPSPDRQQELQDVHVNGYHDDPNRPSILKRKPIEERERDLPTVPISAPVQTPVSILKRKSSEEATSSGSASSFATPPVTFSPTVVDPVPGRKKQGILKKRCSLDESHVARRRSYSPDVAAGNSGDHRSILKGQRRSSLEEIVYARSPEYHPQGILKRKTSREDEYGDRSLGSPEPQSILKRKSGTSSSGSSGNSPHISITTAVILAAAGGAEMIIEPKPILKKKSLSDDSSNFDSLSETPRPILKKKSSTETDDQDERPMKPILKTSRKSLEDVRNCNDFALESPRIHSALRNRNNSGESGSECETVRPILKQSSGSSRENSPRPRLSFCKDGENIDISSFSNVTHRKPRVRRSHTLGDADLSLLLRRSDGEGSAGDRESPNKSLSVFEMVKNFEMTSSTGAIPKSRSPRSSGRFSTQPVTLDEFEAVSLEPVQAFQTRTAESVAEPDANSSSELASASFDSGFASKMECPDDEAAEAAPGLVRSGSVSAKASVFQQLEQQMRAVAEEAKAVRLAKGNKGMQRYRNRKVATTTTESRFSTQPVTLDEVQEAVRAKQRTDTNEEGENESTADEPDPSKLSLAERVKLFNKKITEEHLPIAGGGPAPMRKRLPRFKTQPVTNEEVETAQKISPLAASFIKPPDPELLGGLSIRAAQDKMFEHASKMLTNEVKGILKSKSAVSPIPRCPSPDRKESKPLKSVLKQSHSASANNGRNSSSEDEGVSTENDSSTDSEKKYHSSSEKENAEVEKINKRNKDESVAMLGECMKELEYKNKIRRTLEEVQQKSSSTEGTPQTSDGESSGGREVRRIIANEAVARRRQQAVGRQKEKSSSSQLGKSRSQAAVGKTPPNLSVTADDISGSARAGGGGLRRSLTQPLQQEGQEEEEEMPAGGSIADRLAELQHSGNNEWRKRLPKLNTSNTEILELTVATKNKYNESLTEKRSETQGSILAARKDKLETASQQWKKRVEVSDAVNFSVAGRMNQESRDVPALSPLATATGDKRKRTPKPVRFRSKEVLKGVLSTPVSPQKELKVNFKRSISSPGVVDDNNDSDSDSAGAKSDGRRVQVPRPDDDETFMTFFNSVTRSHTCEQLAISADDLDSVTRHSGDLLVQKRTVQVQRRRGATKNPIKALAARSDIVEEYTEIITGVAEREKKRLNVEKLAKHSSMAIEALAGLASKEDFTAVALKKGTALNSSLLPYKDVMLLHVKGRRHVQTRLVAPVASSINLGDNYILVTPTQVYNYVGLYSNVIEQSRGAEIALHIQQKKDLGCKCDQVVTIHQNKTCSRSHLETFWKLLGTQPELVEITEAGHPDEDEIYESAIVDTNMVYELDNEDELVPIENYWGAVPKIEMLDRSKVLVFDFGTEMYVWSGKNVPIERRRVATKLAKELWNAGYDYSECAICPIDAVTLLGDHRADETVIKSLSSSSSRPDWALLCKITQHGETILFREKFSDWPDFSRVIKVKNKDTEKVEGGIVVEPCDVGEMRKPNKVPVDLLLDGTHLGRGTEFYDAELNRHHEITSLGVTAWHILEYEYDLLGEESIGQFHNGSSYVIRWQYTVSVTGRELSGKPSKHGTTMGRDRCAYFCWQGKEASLNEKGAAALLTVELDHERGPQVRVAQGSEPPAFLNLFCGNMAVHMGRRDNSGHRTRKTPWRLYVCRGELQSETHLVEVVCSSRQLRSRASLILTNVKSGAVIVWHGAKASKHVRSLALGAARAIKLNRPIEYEFSEHAPDLRLAEMEEGAETQEVLEALGSGGRQLYMSLLKSPESFDHTPRLFHLSSVSGVFKATEIHSPYGCSDDDTSGSPYPFIQSDLYSAGQPTLFLLDNCHELWLWQGWWPELDPIYSDSSSDDDNSAARSTSADQTGSGAVRWQAERRAAMRTALDYWHKSRSDRKVPPAYLVWAGLEPLRFTNLFPMWTDRDDIAALNIKDGRKPGEMLKIETELARLTQSTYPLEQLLQRPLPDGVDPSHLEEYLSAEDFAVLLGMSRPDFQKLPVWKQTNIKKDKGLF